MNASRHMNTLLLAVCLLALGLVGVQPTPAHAVELADMIMDPGQLKPVDSALKVRPGDPAPDFTLPGVLVTQDKTDKEKATHSGKRLVRLSDYRGKKNVMLTFVPAAFTPVCSGQWPGYNLAKDLFDEYDTEVLGISADNLPSLSAWAIEMHGLWFQVLSDFHPHGAVAKAYGVLRTDGISERAIIIIDKQGVVRFAKSFDINTRPDLGLIMGELHKIAQ